MHRMIRENCNKCNGLKTIKNKKGKDKKCPRCRGSGEEPLRWDEEEYVSDRPYGDDR